MLYAELELLADVGFVVSVWVVSESHSVISPCTGMHAECSYAALISACVRIAWRVFGGV